MTQSPHLTLSELSYYYEPGAPAALDRVSLQIPRG